MEVSVKYIWHDCFMLSFPDFDVVTDFWKLPEGFPGFIDSLSPERPLYVFVSHHHKDHFTPKILSWAQRHERIRYILSEDTARISRYMFTSGGNYRGRYRVDPSLVTILCPGEEYFDSFLKVRAFASTDTGNSYVMTVQGRNILHAGDLNAWIWKDESTSTEVAKALGDYNHILRQIATYAPRLDLALFPVDSRIGRDWWTGASMLVRAIDVRYFIPMHFGTIDNEGILACRRNDAVAFDLYRNPERGCYIPLTTPGQFAVLEL